MNMLTTRFNYRNTRTTGRDTARHADLTGHGARPLSEDELRQFVPSIFAETAHESRSARYGYIPTIEVVRGLAKEGFDPVFACEAKARDESKDGFTKHMVRFRQDAGRVVNPDHINEAMTFGATPELIMVNSHDGSTAYQLLAGFFRFVCANGSICGDGFNEVRVRHSGDAVRQVVEGAFTVVDTFTRAIDGASNMAAIGLNRDMQLAYAGAALDLKYHDEETGKTEAPVSAQALLAPRRHEDKGADLWTTFNVVQENMIRGGLRGHNIDERGRGRRVTTRAVKGIDGNVKLNRALWTLTEQMGKLAKVAA